MMSRTQGPLAGFALLALLGSTAAVGLGAEDASKGAAVEEPSGQKDKVNITLLLPTALHATKIEELHAVAKAATTLAEYLSEGINRDAAQMCADEALRVAYDLTQTHVKKLESPAKVSSI